MEVIIIGSIISVGLFLNKNGLNRDLHNKNIDVFLKDYEKNYNKNIYNSTETINIRKKEQQLANKLYEEANKGLNKSNVFIAGPTSAINNDKNKWYNKLPIEFDENNLKKESTKINDLGKPDFINKNSLDTLSGGWQGINVDNKYDKKSYSKLTGTNVDNYHNNMTPFFGSKVTQNVDSEANNQIFENFTGTNYNYIEKQEISPLFKPTTNVTNVYGTQNMDDSMYDRYNINTIRNNETPIEKIYVGPGLNQGYTSEGTGGFHQENKREYLLPKTTNELRVKTNPKLSFNGRIISGKKISRTGKVGLVEKNKPDSFSVWGEDRLFTTVGDCTGPRQRSKVPLKYTNRKTTMLKNRYNPAGPSGYKAQKSKLGKTSPSFKQLFESFGFRNLFVDYWDSVKSSILNKKQLRDSKKTNFVGNARWASNIQGPHNRHKIYNPNDIAKVTIKETTIHDSEKLNMKPNRPSMIQCKDPNDIARVTIKETNLHDSEKLNMKPNRASMTQVKDPNDIAKVTIKETNLHDSEKLNMKPNRASMIQVKDPNDIAKVTIKETNLHDSEKLNMKPNRANMIQVKDPNDISKTTIKETTPILNHLNNPKDSNDTGYIQKSNVIKALTTHRQTTLTDYTGDASCEEVGGYKIANPEDKNTMRQFTSDYQYDGIAGPATDTKPISYADIYNSTIKTVRQDISKGRTPTNQGPKNTLDSSDYNVITNKLSENNNKLIEKRGVISTKVYNSLPKPEKCKETNNKTKLPNQNRLDVGLLDAFKENPYTQSLHSHVFS